MGVLVWFGVSATVLHPRVLGLILTLSLRQILRRRSRAKVRSQKPFESSIALERQQALMAIITDGTPTPITSVTIKNVYLFYLTLGDIEVCASDGIITRVRTTSVGLRRRQQHQQHPTEGDSDEGDGEKGGWRPVLLKIDGVRVSLPSKSIANVGAPLDRVAEKKGGGYGRGLAEQRKSNQAIRLSRVAVWSTRLVALEVSDLRAAMPVGRVSNALQGYIKDQPWSKKTDNVSTTSVRVIEVKGMRVVGSFSSSSSCISVSAKKIFPECLYRKA